MVSASTTSSIALNVASSPIGRPTSHLDPGGGECPCLVALGILADGDAVGTLQLSDDGIGAGVVVGHGGTG